MAILGGHHFRVLCRADAPRFSLFFDSALHRGKIASMGAKMGIVRLTILLVLFVVHTSADDEGRMPGIIKQVTQRKTIPLAPYVDPLPTIAKVSAFPTPLSITIGMYKTTQLFHSALPPTPIFAYGTDQATAAFPGPTIEAVRGTPYYLTFENHLPVSHILPVDYSIGAAVAPRGGVPTCVHLHGGEVAPDSDGSAFAWYTNNYTDVGPAFTQKTYTYPNLQHAGNLMYHDHALALTRINLLAGLLAAYIIRDPVIETPFNLPAGDEFDRHLIIADRSFNTDGTIFMDPVGNNPDIHPAWRPEYFGDAITVNGRIWPFLDVQRRKYRFRIINASNARYLDLSFVPNGTSPVLPFYVIGSDSSYLAAPVLTTNVVVSVAETFDIVVDFSSVDSLVTEVELLNSAPYPYPGGTPTGPLDSKVMKFNLLPGPVPLDPFTIPANLVDYEPAVASDATVIRNIAFYEYFSANNLPTHLLVNGKRLTDPVTETPKVGSTELWYVINLTGDNHPLHLHIAHIQAISSQVVVNASKLRACMQSKKDPLLCDFRSHAVGAVNIIPDYEKTWKNVVKIPPGSVTTIIVKFKETELDIASLPYPFDATAEPGYVYHCHILDHEDNEMIRPLKLIP